MSVPCPIVSGMSDSAKIIAVVGAVGGAGASSLAASVANAMAAGGRRVVLVDVCAFGPGIEVLLGIESEPGARWPDLVDARGEVETNIALALPQWQQVPVLSMSRKQPAPASDEVTLDVCASLLRNGHDVVIDAPGPAAWTPGLKALLADVDNLFVVVPDTLPGAAGAAAVTAGAAESLPIARGGGGAARASLVVRARRGSRTAPADFAELTGWPVAARYVSERGLDIAIDLGAGPVAKHAKRLRAVGAQLAAQVAV